jgi:hypothetical protein
VHGDFDPIIDMCFRLPDMSLTRRLFRNYACRRAWAQEIIQRRQKAAAAAAAGASARSSEASSITAAAAALNK